MCVRRCVLSACAVSCLVQLNVRPGQFSQPTQHSRYLAVHPQHRRLQHTLGDSVAHPEFLCVVVIVEVCLIIMQAASLTSQQGSQSVSSDLGHFSKERSKEGPHIHCSAFWHWWIVHPISGSKRTPVTGCSNRVHG